ncbi:hypothetical protein CAPTEDRAFT_217537 [Capitella teleta]|uniref:P2X purinoreceptor 7 intracellular domain-containing protein n=1 Tax=Capitella teleta TaxID=283909 RepID=R7UD64_CAPTE|nr:hypothetical protein CAPTEDRAFT_217537 [Capitella teleta]|eukprot:ELU01738.1 hypothetical protein CAPTEDRAFT_217537 [Capitella teleta]
MCIWIPLNTRVTGVCLQILLVVVRTIARNNQCITEHQDFAILLLNQAVLKNCLTCLNHVRMDNWEIDYLPNKSLRWAAYRQFTWWIHGKLGLRVRRPIPACAVTKIRHSFPEADETKYLKREEKIK